MIGSLIASSAVMVSITPGAREDRDVVPGHEFPESGAVVGM
jgi:hypothetical protein